MQIMLELDAKFEWIKGLIKIYDSILILLDLSNMSSKEIY